MKKDYIYWDEVKYEGSPILWEASGSCYITNRTINKEYLDSKKMAEDIRQSLHNSQISLSRRFCHNYLEHVRINALCIIQIQQKFGEPKKISVLQTSQITNNMVQSQAQSQSQSSAPTSVPVSTDNHQSLMTAGQGSTAGERIQQLLRSLHEHSGRDQFISLSNQPVSITYSPNLVEVPQPAPSINMPPSVQLAIQQQLLMQQQVRAAQLHHQQLAATRQQATQVSAPTQTFAAQPQAPQFQWPQYSAPSAQQNSLPQSTRISVTASSPQLAQQQLQQSTLRHRRQHPPTMNMTSAVEYWTYSGLNCYFERPLPCLIVNGFVTFINLQESEKEFLIELLLQSISSIPEDKLTAEEKNNALITEESKNVSVHEKAITILYGVKELFGGSLNNFTDETLETTLIESYLELLRHLFKDAVKVDQDDNRQGIQELHEILGEAGTKNALKLVKYLLSSQFKPEFIYKELFVNITQANLKPDILRHIKTILTCLRGKSYFTSPEEQVYLKSITNLIISTNGDIFDKDGVTAKTLSLLTFIKDSLKERRSTLNNEHANNSFAQILAILSSRGVTSQSSTTITGTIFSSSGSTSVCTTTTSGNKHALEAEYENDQGAFKKAKIESSQAPEIMHTTTSCVNYTEVSAPNLSQHDPLANQQALAEIEEEASLSVQEENSSPSKR